MITAPSSIPFLSVSSGTISSMAATKPKKMASPPIRGMGWWCIRRSSLGTSTAPTFTDSAFTSGVEAKDTPAASPSASSTVQTSWSVRILLRLFNGISLLFGAARPSQPPLSLSDAPGVFHVKHSFNLSP